MNFEEDPNEDWWAPEETVDKLPDFYDDYYEANDLLPFNPYNED